MSGEMKKPKELPAHLGAIWAELVGEVMPAIGTAGMEALCIQVYRMRDAQERITAEGIVTGDAKGNPVPHPALAIERQASAEVRSWLAKYSA